MIDKRFAIGEIIVDVTISPFSAGSIEERIPMKNEKFAILKINSPLFKLFSDGRIPIKCFPEETGQGSEEEADKYHGLNISALCEEETKQLKTILEEMGIKADLRDLEEKGLEILKEHIIGVSYAEFKLF